MNGRAAVDADELAARAAVRDSVRRFLASTRHIATLRGSQMGDEDYDVFVYPR